MTAVLHSDPRWNFLRVPGTHDLQLNCMRLTQGSSPVLFLHGWPGFWYDWRQVIHRLDGGNYDLIAPDFRGFGESDAPDLPAVEFGPDRHAADMLALIDHFELSNILLVAHDIGSSIAQLVVRERPDAFRGLVLCNPAYPGIGTRRFDPNIIPHFWYQGFHNLDLSTQLVAYNRDTVAIYLKFLHQHWGGDADAFIPEELDAVIDTYARPGAFEKSIQYYRARAGTRVAQSNLDPAEYQVRVPTVVRWGDLDPVMRVEWADRLPDFFSNLLDVRVLPEVGHFVPVEAPDEIVSAIKMFD